MKLSIQNKKTKENNNKTIENKTIENKTKLYYNNKIYKHCCINNNNVS